MQQTKQDMLEFLRRGNWNYMLTVTFKGEFEYRPDLLDFKLSALDSLMSHINSKLVNKRWYKFRHQDYVTSFGILELGRYGVNPHYHILLDVPNTQKQIYEALNKAFNDPMVTPGFENLHLAKLSESKRLASYLLKENHWQNGHIYAFCANKTSVATR